MKKKIFAALVAVMLIATVVYATTIRDDMRYEGNVNLGRNKTLTVESGSKINLAAGAALQFGGTNAPSATEMAYLTSVTAGTAAANKALVLNATKGAADFGALNGSALGFGSANLTTAAVVNFASSNAVITGGSANVTSLGSGSANITAIAGVNAILTGAVNVPAAGIGSGNFTTLKIAGANVVATALDLGTTAGVMSAAASNWTLSTGGANTQLATLQVKDANGTAISSRQFLRIYLASDATCTTAQLAGAVNYTTTITGAGNMIVNEGGSNTIFGVLTNTAGAVNVLISNAGAAANLAAYLCAVAPNGKLAISGVTDVVLQ
jgi:hypothetical protein